MHDVTLVLLPGLDGTGELFCPILSCLSHDIGTIPVSYPSDVPLTYCELLPRVLTALPKMGRFIILGESFSGPLALMAAVTHPASLVGVILCASFVRNPLWLRPRWLKYLVHPVAFKWFHKLSPLKTLLGGYSTPELRQMLARALAPVRPNVLACRAREVLQVDVREQLRTCSVPVLYLQAESDGVVRGQNLTDVLNLNPSVKVARIQGPHLLLQTQPKAAADAIRAFMSQL
jgi:pimeloyl-[acyl-carrier protein] methyl ester esterase